MEFCLPTLNMLVTNVGIKCNTSIMPCFLTMIWIVFWNCVPSQDFLVLTLTVLILPSIINFR